MGLPTRGLVSKPWVRVLNEKSPDRVFVMSQRNYKMFADIGEDIYRLRRMLTVLGTGAGPNGFRKADFPLEVEVKSSVRLFPDICVANNKPLALEGVFQLPVRLGNRLSLVEFLLCSKLAVPAILCGDYCDTFVAAIRPRVTLVELDDCSTVPIVRRPRSVIPKQHRCRQYKNTCGVEVSHRSSFERWERPQYP